MLLCPFFMNLYFLDHKHSFYYSDGSFDLWCAALQVSLNDVVICLYFCVARLKYLFHIMKAIGHNPLVDTYNTCANAQYYIKVELHQ
jgi:hypothetical protein